MYLNRSIVFLIALGFVFYPSVMDWLTSGDSVWYRPYQLWLLIVIAAWWNQRTRVSDDL